MTNVCVCVCCLLACFLCCGFGGGGGGYSRHVRELAARYAQAEHARSDHSISLSGCSCAHSRAGLLHFSTTTTTTTTTTTNDNNDNDNNILMIDNDDDDNDTGLHPSGSN